MIGRRKTTRRRRPGWRPTTNPVGFGHKSRKAPLSSSYEGSLSYESLVSALIEDDRFQPCRCWNCFRMEAAMAVGDVAEGKNPKRKQDGFRLLLSGAQIASSFPETRPRSGTTAVLIEQIRCSRFLVPPLTGLSIKMISIEPRCPGTPGTHESRSADRAEDNHFREVNRLGKAFTFSHANPHSHSHFSTQ